MHSIRTKTTMLTVCGIIMAIIVVTVLSVLFINNTERHKSDQLLLLLCETGERNLDYYFNEVEGSLDKVATFAEDDIKGLDDKRLAVHVDNVEKYFDTMANRTSGVLTYYYRIDPSVSKNVKGFWYTDLDGDEFVEHEVTDITQYDTEDTSKLVWFTVPKATGKPVWLPPYITDNLDVNVISYNIPVYYRNQFVGVVGIEIDYSTMAEQVENIRLFQNGYAYINDDNGELIFHPYIDVATMDRTKLEKPKGIVSDNTFFQYDYDGVKKEAVWLPLSNGMRLNVAVPFSEINGDWDKLIIEIVVASLIVLLLLSLITLRMTGHITRPLNQLTAAAEQVDKGNYDFELNYDQDDEVGMLTRTFVKLSNNVQSHIDDLNSRVYVDALTSVQNKAAFTAKITELENQMYDPDHPLEFAVGMFDCDDLKVINDKYGHEKGDIYLKESCHLICRTFKHSPVYRIGGDEFAAILQNGDYQNREELSRRFEEEREAIREAKENKWEQIHIAMGIAVYDPKTDGSVDDTVRRADKMMYMNKSAWKESRYTESPRD